MPRQSNHAPGRSFKKKINTLNLGINKRVHSQIKSKTKLFKIDRKGSQEEQRFGRKGQHQKPQLKTRKPMGYNHLLGKERQLATELFGDDANLPDTPGGSQHPSQFKKVVKKKRGDGRNVTGKQMIPDDPFDIHGVKNKEERKAVWVDEDDINIKERMYKETSGQHHSQIMRERFIKMSGDTADWADLDLVKDEDGTLARSTGDYISSTHGLGLPKGVLSTTQLTNLNKETQGEPYIIKALEFNKQLPMAVVAGYSDKIRGSATLFKVDGKNNQKIQSIRMPGFPVKFAKFLHDGRKYAMGNNYNEYFIVHDMESGHSTNIHTARRNEKGNFKEFVMSPDGSLMVFLGKEGQLYLYDARFLTYIDTLYAPMQVAAATFNDSGTKMYTHGESGHVFVWDMDARQCIHRFYDDGCIDGTSITMSSRHLACGSSSGMVNVYDTSSLVSSPSPTPVKILSKLVHPINFMTFNPTGEILITASNEANEAIRAVHFPSMTYMEKFPLPNFSVKRVQTASFSPMSGYLAVGNSATSAYLYRLNHYTNY